MRIVLYAEGAGELLGTISQLPPVGEALRPESWGPAHELIARMKHEPAPASPAELRFDSPKRFRGRLAKGSDLHNERALRELLSWFRPDEQPDLAVVLVDADGDQQRANRLRQAVSSLKVPAIVVASIQEFEAWLIADHACVSAVLGSTGPLPGATDAPETLAPRAAKALLAQWMERAGCTEASAQRDVRRRIARECSLPTLRDRCRAFATFASELSAVRS